MPRSRKKKSDEPVAVSDTLNQLKDSIPGLKAATDLADPNSPKLDPKLVAEFTAALQDEPPSAAPEPGAHAAAVLAKRPKLAPAPPGFFEVASDRQAGMRISKSHDHKSVAIQFAEDRLPERGEKDILERVGHPEDGQNFVYKPQHRQWMRPVPEGWAPGENTLDAVRVMQELAQARNESRGR